jgi:hypothetical protein
VPKRIQFRYKNHRGEEGARDVTVDSIAYLRKPGFSYEPGFFIMGYCHDKQAQRSFAFCNVVLPPDELMPYRIIKL